MRRASWFPFPILPAFAGLVVGWWAERETHAAGTPPPTDTATTMENGFEFRGFSKALRPDEHRTFRPESARLGSRSFLETQKPQIPTFSQLRSFSGSKSFESKTYSSGSFATSQVPEGLKSFPSGPSSASSQKPFQTNPNTESGKTFNSFGFSESAKRIPSTSAPQASRPYLGEEADRMKQKYTPDNGPRGGVVQGHRLSVEELREILNRSK